MHMGVPAAVTQPRVQLGPPQNILAVGLDASFPVLEPYSSRAMALQHHATACSEQQACAAQVGLTVDPSAALALWQLGVHSPQIRLCGRALAGGSGFCPGMQHLTRR